MSKRKIEGQGINLKKLYNVYCLSQEPEDESNQDMKEETS